MIGLRPVSGDGASGSHAWVIGLGTEHMSLVSASRKIRGSNPDVGRIHLVWLTGAVFRRINDMEYGTCVETFRMCEYLKGGPDPWILRRTTRAFGRVSGRILRLWPFRRRTVPLLRTFPCGIRL